MEEQRKLGEGAKIIASVYEAFERGDVQALSVLFDPRVRVRQSPLLPWGGIYQGYLGIMRFIAKLLEHVESRIAVDEYLEAGEQVIVIGHTRGHVRATGKEFSVRFVHVWSLKDGRVVRYEPYVNTAKMLEALKG
jgi:ketosteroid isomerase-like protein